MLKYYVIYNSTKGVLAEYNAALHTLDIHNGVLIIWKLNDSGNKTLVEVFNSDAWHRVIMVDK